MKTMQWAVICRLCAITLFHQGISGVTEVYNLRVSNITSERIDLEGAGDETSTPAIFTSKLVTRLRENKRGDDQLLIADVSNFIYSYKNWYARADGAVGYVRERIKEITTKHTQLDDLLLSTGYRHLITSQVHLSYSLLAGIPLHKDDGFQFFQFGTGHYALGAQIDGIFRRAPSAWVSALRYVHFFKSHATIPLDGTCLSADFALGDLIDTIVSYYRQIRKNHSIEIGYNPTFSFNMRTDPPLDPRLPSYNIRNSWYSIYRYNFVRGRHPMGIGLSASYGFDLAPKIDAAVSRNISFWISYTVRF